MQKFEVVKKCWNQDTKEQLHPGDVVSDLSSFEIGRHLAEGNIIPVVKRNIEKAIVSSRETRRRGRKKKE